MKYSKDDVSPKISIFEEEIFENEIYESKIISNEEYCKIVIVDNGIGFKQEYSSKIFNLFYRLEKDSKYSGTGLGLAICKRIVENHDGFIQVSSVPGEGAEFAIFIPRNI